MFPISIACRDSPDGLVGNDNLAPVLDLVRHSLELTRDNLDRLACLALLQTLTTAQNHTEAAVERSLGLAGHKLIRLVENDAALRVSENRPVDAAVLELLGRDFTCEGAVWLVEDVLCCYFEALAEVLAGEEEVQSWRGNDNLLKGR